MKKITKRIMALMLSLVMIIGCIPSFINEASAIDINTVRDLLNYNGFPKNLDNYLLNTNGSNGEKMYVVGDYLVVDGVQMLLLDVDVTPGDSCYTANNGISFKFNVQMQNNTLTSIEISGYNLNTDFNGTYEPVPTSITISDVLNTVPGGFPAALDKAWTNESGDRVIFNNSYLEFYKSGSNNPEESLRIEGTQEISDYSISIMMSKISFDMKDGKLDTITITLLGKGDCEGEYKPVKTIADILTTVEGGFPNEPSTGWISANEYTTFCAGNALWFQNPESYIINTDTILTLNADGNYENTTEKVTFVMTDEKLTSIVSTKTNYAGTYEPAVKTLTVTYEQPKTLEELTTLMRNTATITVNANATSISNFTKKETEGVPLYIMANNDPDFLGYFVILTPITFNDDGIDDVDRVFLRDIDLGKPTKTLDDIKSIASTIDYAVAIDGSSILVIEKFDFSKKLNITASLNANMKVIDAIDSIKDNITDDGIVRNYSIKEDPDGDPLDDDATLEAGKKYYLNGIIKNVVDSICYNQVSINNKVLPYDSPANPEKPNSFSNTMYSNKSEDCGFLVNYEFTATSNSSGSSKKYKTNNTSDSAEKVSGSGKKGSTRTITPIEGKKVSSVIVTDKDGNKVDVTLNEDGTYSFKQPASDVNIEVNYKNREITLNIGSTEASVDGEKSNLDVCPVVRNDRTMLPIRFIAENLGAIVEWNEPETNMVYITRGDTKIEIKIGSDIMKVNGKEVKLDSVAFAENDRTYLPVRAISEALNAIVEWNENEPSVVKIYER